ncbi:MAG TPA: transglycosylase domain-containing protein [Solirubrobacteraceae bacterium]|nr:transglycosylase domain-containing protein [Solirubrobacteraceae bacterium]
MTQRERLQSTSQPGGGARARLSATVQAAEATTGARRPPAPGEQAPETPDEAPIRRRLRKLRLISIIGAALLLAGVSFLYGIFMAVVSDLPQLEDRYQFTHARNSYLLDDHGRPLAVLSEQHRILLSAAQIPRIVKDAVISVEDKRFYSEPGIDPQGILRAALEDILHPGAVQGASTITEQFVKNALAAQDQRTIFEKLREAALAFQLAHKWPKEKILAEYLDTIYFGEGAYGIEAAAQTYFGHEPGHSGCGLPGAPLCVSQLSVAQAAMLAGVIASPTGFDPVTHPRAALARRSLALADMLAQHYISPAEYRQAMATPLPSPLEVQPPEAAPVDGLQTGYFTSWVEGQLIERYGAQRALEGGLTVHTTIDLELQRAAEAAVASYLSGPGGPTASLVAIENSTGDVRAMVGGPNFNSDPFNLATEGERQPGSAFKAFDLAAALERGISPYSVWSSRPKVFIVPGTGGHEKFYVHNDGEAYAPGGYRTLIEATAYSDNTVFSEMGIDVGTGKIAQIAHKMGIETPISTNPAMTIGGLKVGVSPLEMAHAYETIAHGGQRVDSSFEPSGEPTGIQEVTAPAGETLPNGASREVNHVRLVRVLPESVAAEETKMLETVVQYGTARMAALGQFAAGKTGTTTNYTDAWFVGWDDKYTVAVWVGFPAHPVPMYTDFNGGPVEGGTFPALIWHSFMVGAMQIEREHAEGSAGATQHAAAAGTESTSAPSAGMQGRSATAAKGPTEGGAGRAGHAPSPAVSHEGPAGGSGSEAGASAQSEQGAAKAPAGAPEKAEAPSASGTQPGGSGSGSGAGSEAGASSGSPGEASGGAHPGAGGAAAPGG